MTGQYCLVTIQEQGRATLGRWWIWMYRGHILPPSTMDDPGDPEVRGPFQNFDQVQAAIARWIGGPATYSVRTYAIPRHHRCEELLREIDA